MDTGYVIPLSDNMRYGSGPSLCEVCAECVVGSAEDAKKTAADDLQGKLEKFAGVPIKILAKDNPNLVIFPRDLTTYVDDIEESWLFALPYVKSEFHIETGNLMGAFGIGGVKISIGSRFDFDAETNKSSNKPYFMHYVLMKVLGLHVLNLPTHESYDPIDEFCVFLFPMALKSAMAKGLFKAYRRFEYNDSNIKGAIDVARHLRTNVPFRGLVAYATREHTSDNPIMQLARHAIEFIKAGPYREILTRAEKDVREVVDQVIAATPTYARQQRTKVIGQNLRPVRHPYFSEYTLLQKISLQILRHEKMAHGLGSNELAGVIFDGAWLWEEYLNKVMSESPGLGIGGELVHPRNKAKETPLYIYKPSRHKVYPDFLWRSTSANDQKWDVVLDAKYKKACKVDEKGNQHFAIAREDRFQMIGYMHLTKANAGVIVCPMTKKETEEVDESDFKSKAEDEYVEGDLLGHGGSIAVVPFVVPPARNNFEQYCKDMKAAEANYCDTLSRVIESD